ncbi:uncharacterized protein LOC114037060 [Vombatus ursinus]|uniref:uncharacterized protein LOC114037060 n=1 Tax=Vombatus ursinus TaxID=29139 RepID=UPI000FFD3151|nr:uncharacterized protein LOC114037060 [Vombatus ursinus]
MPSTQQTLLARLLTSRGEQRGAAQTHWAQAGERRGKSSAGAPGTSTTAGFISARAHGPPPFPGAARVQAFLSPLRCRPALLLSGAWCRDWHCHERLSGSEAACGRGGDLRLGLLLGLAGVPHVEALPGLEEAAAAETAARNAEAAGLVLSAWTLPAPRQQLRRRRRGPEDRPGPLRLSQCGASASRRCTQSTGQKQLLPYQLIFIFKIKKVGLLLNLLF